MSHSTAIVDNVSVTVENEKNLLELIRKAGIELPTFCYHSDISVYGACRMCMVDVEGRGIVAACSTNAEPGMVIKTNTHQIRQMRKMIIELMLASHDCSCVTCPKSGDCRLQSIATQLGVKKVRFQQMHSTEPVDLTSPSVAHDPAKCILCGDCVRTCKEIQSVGALDFAHRGVNARVISSFNKGLGEAECVNCGQCILSCPVGALTIRSNVTDVWEAIYNKEKTVIVQVAPASRVALGEYFDQKPGTLNIGKMISAMRRMGFDKVYDTCFGADFTVVEEGKEFLERYEKGHKLPLFTSCCPSWVKFAEQYYPDLLDNFSTCKSPQQMFGSLVKDKLTKDLGISRENLVVVSVMPCTSKKFEAKREEFFQDGNPDVDFVITTKELATMMHESGMEFDKLPLDSFDMPFGFATGAGLIFGSSGGVSEAVMRFAADTLEKGSSHDFKELRRQEGVKTREIEIAGKTLRLAVVSGLANARALIDKIRSGEEQFDLVEIMACPGGCVNGGGQPVHYEQANVCIDRANGLYDADKTLQFHVSNENPYLQKIYDEGLDKEKAHKLLHTSFENRKRINLDALVLNETSAEEKAVKMSICLGTSCFVRGSQTLYTQLMEYMRTNNLTDSVEFTATFCSKSCNKGPVVTINDKVIEQCTLEKATTALAGALK